MVMTPEQLRWKLLELSENIEENISEMVIEVIADVGDSVTADPMGHEGTGTPRDTQRATNGWNVANGLTGDFSDPGPGLYGEPDARAEAYSKLPHGTMGASIANGVPYILDLDMGTSAQAPAGFVKRAIDRAIEGIDNVNLFEKDNVRRKRGR